MCGILWIEPNEYKIFRNIITTHFFFSFYKGLKMFQNDIIMYIYFKSYIIL